MLTIGSAIINPNIDIDECVIGTDTPITKEEFLKQVLPHVAVTSIAVDKSEIMIIIENPIALVTIPRKYVIAVYPLYKDENGYITCSEFSVSEKYRWAIEIKINCPDKNPENQLLLFYKKYPEFWEREERGEFNWTSK